MATDNTINNANEINNFRQSTVWNHTAGTLKFNNSTGREYVHIAHKSGSNLTFGNQATSEFNPNNRQTLTNGDTFQTTKGNHHIMAEQLEQRVFGDVTILTGNPNMYSSSFMNSYMQEQATLAAHKASPELKQPGFSNVTGSVHKAAGGQPDPLTGSTQGKSFTKNESHQNMTQIYKDTQKKLTPFEKEMGNGGSIKLLSGKDLLLMAGTAPSNFDTVFINPVGRKVKQKFEYDNNKTVTLKETSAPYFEEKDVATGVPFGNIHIQAGNKLDLNSAAGGINLGTSGPIRLSTKAITYIGGAQVNIAGSAGEGATGDVFITSGDHIEINGPNINIKGKTHVFIEPGLSVEGNQIIKGDLVVSGNLTVIGNIVCKGAIGAVGNIGSEASIQSTQDIQCGGSLSVVGSIHCSGSADVAGSIGVGGGITAGGDIVADNAGTKVSLLNHIHLTAGIGVPSPPFPGVL